MAIRDDVFAADDLPREMVPTPEWPGTDGKIFARCLSGDERDEYEIFMAHQVDRDALGDDEAGTFIIKMGSKHLRSILVAKGACDEDGDSIFLPDDVVRLGLKSAAPLERIRMLIKRLSGMLDDEEETAKNLPEAPGESSPSDSALPSDTLPAEDSSES